MSALRAAPAIAVMTRQPPVTTLLVLAAAAWLALAALAASPWRGDIGHAALEDIAAHPGALATLAAGWVLMVLAMMLPTSMALFAQFGRLTASRTDRRRLVAILAAAYVAVWLVVGLAMHAGDLGVHALAGSWPWLAGHAWTIQAATLALAGAYQFSALKERCATRCRTPESFIRAHWHGVSASAETLRLGLDHAAYCVGCCWALMLVMFSVGVASFAAMAALTVVMAAQKTQVLGRRVSTPVGVWLLAGALLTVIAR